MQILNVVLPKPTPAPHVDIRLTQREFEMLTCLVGASNPIFLHKIMNMSDLVADTNLIKGFTDTEVSTSLFGCIGYRQLLKAIPR